MLSAADFVTQFMALVALIVVVAICFGTVIVVAIRAYWISRSASYHWLRMGETKKGDNDGRES